jgi:hypothetical protein
MRKRFRTLAACCTLALMSVPASGVAPVEYRVDAKAFKAARAESELTFSAFSDAGCTTLVDATPLLANDSALVFERPKTVAAKGAKPPKLIVIRTNLATAAAGPFYLTVTGDGITPVGDACQPQAGGAQGPPGEPGEPATALWVVMNADGGIVRGSGAVNSSALDPVFGSYEVVFDRDVTTCAYVGSVGQPTGGGAPDAFVSTAPRNGNANAVLVEVRTSGGVSSHQPFHLAVFCP